MNTTYRIEIAVDHNEAEKFCAWLNDQGHDAKIGRTTGNSIDGRWTATNDEADEIMGRLWEEYCS